MRRIIIAVLMIVGIASFAWFLNLPAPLAPTGESAADASPPPRRDSTLPVDDDGGARDTAPSGTLTAEAFSAPEESGEYAEEIDDNFLAPSGNAVREEAEANPHGTPQALLQFANQTAEIMDEARQSETAATRAFERFEDCVTDSQSAAQARLLCVYNAKALAEMYPQALAARFASLRTREPKLFRVYGLLGEDS